MAIHNYDFVAAGCKPELADIAAAIACLHSNDILKLITNKTGKEYTNIAVSFAKPSKPHAAIHLLKGMSDQDVSDLLASSEVRGYFDKMQTYNASGRGKPITQYINAAGGNTSKAFKRVVPTTPVEATPTPTPAPETTITVDTITPTKRFTETVRDGVTTITDTKSGREAYKGLAHSKFCDLLNLTTVKDADGYVFPIWLPGPAGSGKTTAAKHLAGVFNLEFYFTGAIDNEYKLLGFKDAGGSFHETPFYTAYKNGGVFLLDEVDASLAQAIVVFNAAMENGVCAFGNGEIVRRHPNCVLIAAGNTYGGGATHEYVGRNKLDAASVDRFIMLDWNYDEALECALSSNLAWTRKVQAIRKAVYGCGIKHVVSPRASIRGSGMLAAGFDEDTVMQAVVYKGLSPDHIRAIKGRI